MPKKFPPEFKRDVVTVARRGDLTVAEVAADFDISVESVRRWMRPSDIDDGVVGGLTTSVQSELVQLRREKRRLEMENEILLRTSLIDAHRDDPESSATGSSRTSSSMPATTLASDASGGTAARNGCGRQRRGMPALRISPGCDGVE